MEQRFHEIIRLINQSRKKAIKVVNAELINLYWNIGKHISNKIERSEWGESVVTELAKYIQNNEPQLKGFSDKNLWRMKRFYDVYKGFPKLSTVLREISWSNNLTIISRCKTHEEREQIEPLEHFEQKNNLQTNTSSSLHANTLQSIFSPLSQIPDNYSASPKKLIACSFESSIHHTKYNYCLMNPSSQI